MLRRVGKEPEFKDGLRVTDAETLEIVRMVLVGKINRDLVATINSQAGDEPVAVGVSGEDAGLLEVTPADSAFGFVGNVTKVRDPIDLAETMTDFQVRNHWTPARTKRFREHFVFEHLDTNEIGQLASKAAVKSVVLYHYDPHTKADQAAYVAGAKKYFAGPVFAPNDLDRYCLTSGLVAPCGSGARR
jgi:hypothetical protein